VGLKVTLHGRAERDLQDIIDHRAQEHGAQVAEHVHDDLLDAMRRVVLRPFLLGRPTATPDVRLLSLRRYPSKIGVPPPLTPPPQGPHKGEEPVGACRQGWRVNL
jgi:plasmid stabilization system protein ParE